MCVGASSSYFLWDTHSFTHSLMRSFTRSFSHSHCLVLCTLGRRKQAGERARALRAPRRVQRGPRPADEQHGARSEARPPRHRARAPVSELFPSPLACALFSGSVPNSLSFALLARSLFAHSLSFALLSRSLFAHSPLALSTANIEFAFDFPFFHASLALTSLSLSCLSAHSLVLSP